MEEEIGKTAGVICEAINTNGERYLSELKKAVKGKQPTGTRSGDARFEIFEDGKDSLSGTNGWLKNWWLRIN